MITRIPLGLALGLAALSLGACDKLVDGSNAAAHVSAEAFNDTKSTWTELFTYHPKQPDPLPQTRYCYQMQSDVVCYDSEQPKQTAKLVGYQDAEAVGWVQPGGGSTGASGGEAIALRPPLVKRQVPGATQVVQDVYTGPTETIPNPKGTIAINSLPPVKN